MLLYNWLVDLLPNFLLFHTVNPPHITRNLEDQSVATGANITFRIEASGDSLEFQWKKNGDDIDSNESRLCSSKPNTSTLQIPCVKKCDQGHYKCIVKNPVEHSEVSSHEADLTVCKFVAMSTSLCFVENFIQCYKNQSVSTRADIISSVF